MPHKPDREGWTLPPEKDRRRKLSPADREAIRANVKGLSQLALANQYGVSKRLVQFIQHPQKHAANLEARQKRGGWQQYYKKEEHAQAMQSTRRHRLNVYNNQTKGA